MLISAATINKQLARRNHIPNLLSNHSGSPEQGMTLFEILVVVLILATLSGLIAPRLIGALGNPLKNTTGKIGMLSRQLHYGAKLKQKTYRLVIDMTEGKQGLWVESGPARVLIDGPDATPPPRPRSKEEEQAQQARQQFSVDTALLKKPMTLPNGATFEYVEVGLGNKPQREGRAYIHFFSTGLGDQGAIHITDKKNHWTIGVHPLTGRVIILTKDVPLKDLAEEL